MDLDQRKGRVHDCSLHSSTHTYDVAVDYYPHARSVSPCSFFLLLTTAAVARTSPSFGAAPAAALRTTRGRAVETME